MKYLIYIILLIPFTLKGSILDTVPQTMNIGHVSSSWEPEYADASAEIAFIESPKANFSGNAQLAFPITLPAGRQNMQPNLSINYDSENANSWLGYGWNLNVSSIDLDTRWGAPTFSNEVETEIYLLNGEQMGPVFHRAAEFPREAERNFVLRQTFTFQTIIRHGTSPTNYWWEVQETDGTKKYYGGTPETGLSTQHILSHSDGIVKWMLMKEMDSNGNNILYNYQHIDGSLGRNSYPASIIYTGHENEAGKYSVHFSLNAENRTDISSSGRLGFISSEERLLGRIDVRFQDQQIRAYKLTYQTGVFGKTLLQKIEVLDSEDNFFYDYDFHYYDDLETNNSPFTSDVNWQVPKDDIDITNITGNIEAFNGKPTLLGSANSQSIGFISSITIGFPSAPTTKDFTVGPNGGFTNNTSNGVTAFVDINGDGLPDKIWKENDALFFRPNLFAQGNAAFGQKTMIQGVNDFSISSTNSWNLGAELNLPPAYAGYTHEEGTTKTSTYFIDFNGDELIDIVNRGKVFFNHLDNGVPTFTEDVGLTQSIIYKGEPLDPSTIQFDPAELEQEQNLNPLHDVVRVWRAPFDGNISINADVNLIEDTSVEAQEYGLNDGVRVSIQAETQELWSEVIAEDDFTIKSPTNVDNLQITEGDLIYFRVHSIDDGLYDEVKWNPIITYNINDYVDADDNLVSRYEAQEDFLISEKKSLHLNFDGTIDIECKIEKPILSDNIRFHIGGTVNESWVLEMNDIIDSTFILNDIPVNAQDDINFSLQSLSNVAWENIVCEPVIIYTSLDDGSETEDENGDPLYSFCGTTEYQGYFIPDLVGAPVSLNGAENATIEINFDNSIPLPEMNISIKLKGEKDSTINIPFVDTPNFSTEISVENFDTLFIDLFHEHDINFAPLFISSLVSTNQSFSPDVCGLWRSTSYRDNQYGHMYRGWGQFIYDGNNGRGTQAIDLSQLEIDPDEAANDTLQIDPDAESTDLEGTGNNGELITAMTSDSKLLAWRGSDEFAFVKETTMGSSRKGRKNVSANSFNAGSGDNFTSPELISRYYSNGGFGGLGVPGTSVSGSAGYTAATSFSTLDVIDFNGDRYPDVITETSIQYTNFRGGLTETPINYEWGIHEAFSEAFSIGTGLNPGSTSAKNSGAAPGTGSNKSTSRVKQTSRSNTSKARSSFESATEAVGLSASFGSDNDRAIHTFLDINGDGMEDKVWENGDVALNTGYSFSSIRNWGFDEIRNGNAVDLGAGLGINISNGSIMGGISATKTFNASEKGFVDLNGDALLDLIISTDPIMVRFNTGNGFTDPMQWLENEDWDVGESLGESVNAGFTVSLVFPFIKISFNFQSFLGQGTGNVYQVFQDVNGDGFADYLTAENSDDNLSVRYSNIGRTNLLERVDYPLGAEMTLNYEIKGNNTNLPYTKWTMSELVMYDGLEGDGSDYSQQSFDYENGYHDRHERQFYGFGEVTTSYISGERVDKKLIEQFHVDNFYTKSLPMTVSLFDTNDNLHKEINYTYDLFDIETGIILPSAYKERDDGMTFPGLTQETLLYTEGLDQISIQETNTYTYDLNGNIINQKETDSNGYFKETLWQYAEDLGNGIKSNIITEQILGLTQILSKTEFDYSPTGKNTQIRSFIDENNAAITNMEYDNYGNIVKIIKPENYKGEHLEMEFVYENELNQYRTEVLDNYGYQESNTYEYLFGTKTSFTDKNGLITSFGVDPKGRPEFSLLPIDLDMGNEFSIRYDYNLSNGNNHATATFQNPSQDKNIRTYSFSDGLHRNVQTKEEAIISNGTSENLRSIVSGQNTLDSLGRIVEEYLDIDEPISMINTYNANKSSISPVIFSYDLNDRIKKIINIDGGVTDFNYSIQQYDSKNLLSVEQTNPKGLRTDLLYSTRNELISEQIRMPGEESVESYVYNEISELQEITHPSGSKTFYTYDLLGRRITVDVPDAGLTELVYDNAGNLLEKITANVRDGLNENASIRYTYDRERLLTIDYPKNFQNKVEIHYGDSEALFNRIGRIWLLEDGTGGREFFYDEFGNLTKEIRTVIINRSETYTYITEFEHDAFNRIAKLIYPDGEELSYIYDETGRLDQIIGEKEHFEYRYIDNIHYDLYLEQIKINYGNGVEEVTVFDDKGRVINQLLSSNIGLLTDEDYMFDLEDNITTLKNSTSDELIGTYEMMFTYDERSRLLQSEGLWNRMESSSSYEMNLSFNPNNTLISKEQKLNINDNQDNLRSRSLSFDYEDPAYPTRPSTISGRDHSYDLNGNLNLVNSQTVFDFEQYVYDEENRLMAASENGNTSLYTYDAFGRRTLKSQGSIQGIFINGAPAGLVEHLLNYRVDVNPYFTVFDNDFRKHVFIDQQRIVSKIGTGRFQTNLGAGPEITAGGIDYKARIQAYEQQILDYYASLGVPPGPPTLLALLGQPEINLIGFGDIDSNNPFESTPPNWPVINEPNPDGPPGSPVFYNIDGTNNESVAAGYNFVDGEITQELEQFYFHYNVKQDVSYITGSDGAIRQYKLFLPSGETWIQEQIGIDSSDYAFGGLLFDKESSLYYLGEVYYDPIKNFELSVDKIEQTFGIETTSERIEGDLFYDFADFEENIAFDPQILNPERTSPFLPAQPEIVDFTNDNGDGFVIDFTEAVKNEKRIKDNRRNAVIIPGNDLSNNFIEVFEAFEIANLQSPEGVNPNDTKEFRAIVKQAKKNKIRKDQLKNKKRNNKLKVSFRIK